MGGRYRFHRHPKAVVEQPKDAPAPGIAPPPPAPEEGPSFQFHLAMNSMYVATGL